jgi:hypothetical protein
MTNFHVRYWFESNGPDRTGEQVIEAIEAETVEQAAKQVQDRISREPFFTITPAFGPAARRISGSGNGLVLIQSAQVRYVEFISAPASGNQAGGRA